MDVFVVVQNGIYRHDIVGVYSAIEAAANCAELAIGAEPDCHHSYEVVKVPFDRDLCLLPIVAARERRDKNSLACEEVVGELSRRPKGGKMVNTWRWKPSTGNVASSIAAVQKS